MTREQKEAITYARQRMEQLVEKLEKNKRADALPQQEGILYALDLFFEFDENDNCIGINMLTVYENLARKYSEIEKTKMKKFF